MRRLFRLPGRSADVARDVESELCFHLDMRTRELIESGMGPQAARLAALQAKQLTAGIERQYSEDVNLGFVIDWFPKDRPVEKNGEVTVTISDGPEPRTLPDVSGLTYEEAAQRLTDKGLVPKRADVFSDDVAAGKVVGTKPRAGQQANRGDTVTIEVSKGPDLVAVPDVTGMDVDDAVNRIEAAGLRVVSIQGPFRRKVFATDPEAGKRVEKGSGVTLYTR